MPTSARIQTSTPSESGHVEYLILVNDRGVQYRIKRRFKQFVSFDRQLRAEGITVSVSLPPKLWGSFLLSSLARMGSGMDAREGEYENALAERHKGLQKYLDAVVYLDHDLVRLFLGVDEYQHIRSNLIRSSKFMQERQMRLNVIIVAFQDMLLDFAALAPVVQHSEHSGHSWALSTAGVLSTPSRRMRSNTVEQFFGLVRRNTEQSWISQSSVNDEDPLPVGMAATPGTWKDEDDNSGGGGSGAQAVSPNNRRSGKKNLFGNSRSITPSTSTDDISHMSNSTPKSPKRVVEVLNSFTMARAASLASRLERAKMLSIMSLRVPTIPEAHKLAIAEVGALAVSSVCRLPRVDNLLQIPKVIWKLPEDEATDGEGTGTALSLPASPMRPKETKSTPTRLSGASASARHSLTKADMAKIERRKAANIAAKLAF